jgi:hypothetical protein
LSTVSAIGAVSTGWALSTLRPLWARRTGPALECVDLILQSFEQVRERGQVDDVLDPDFLLLAGLLGLDTTDNSILRRNTERPEFCVVLDAWNYIRRCDASNPQQDKTKHDQNNSFHLSPFSGFYASPDFNMPAG